MNREHPRSRVAPPIFVIAFGNCWPVTALAQEVHPIWVGFALSPILGIALSIAAALIVKSWRVGVLSIVLVFVWLAWFVLASMYTVSDAVIWAPLFAFAAHLLVLVFILLWRTLGVSRRLP